MKKGMHINLLVAAAGLTVISLTSAARAVVNVDATFSSGASLDNFGFTPTGNPPPNALVDTSAGKWNNNLADGEVSYWANNGIVDQFTQTLFHGKFDVQVNTFSTFGNLPRPEEFTLGYMTTPGQYLVQVGVVSGNINILTFPGGAATFVDVPVSNTDSLQHQYGYEINRTTGFVKLFFDGAQVGAPGGYLAKDTSAHGGKQFYLGDGSSGGAHNEVWDRVVIAEGAFPVPEPASMSVIALGGTALLRRRRR
jgi:hypothetical protein